MVYIRGREDLDAYRHDGERGAHAWPAQRRKIEGQLCVICKQPARDPAHIVPQTQWGGCRLADCVVPLCRDHHKGFDLMGGSTAVLLRPMLALEAVEGLVLVECSAELEAVASQADYTPLLSRKVSERMWRLCGDDPRLRSKPSLVDAVDPLASLEELRELVTAEFHPELDHIERFHSDVPFELLLDALRGHGWPGLGLRYREPCPGISERERLKRIARIERHF